MEPGPRTAADEPTSANDEGGRGKGIRLVGPPGGF